MHSNHPKSRWVSLRRNKRGDNIPAWKVSWRSTHLLLAVLVTALPLALSAGAAQQQTFGRLFPELPPYHAPDDTALDALTVAGTTTSPGPLFDDGTAPGNNPDGVPAFFTYFGQFLDHDMTLDTLPLPMDFVDPNTIPNNRDQRLNLDSVYGNVKKRNPALFEADGKHFKVNGRDLPRNPERLGHHRGPPQRREPGDRADPRRVPACPQPADRSGIQVQGRSAVDGMATPVDRRPRVPAGGARPRGVRRRVPPRREHPDAVLRSEEGGEGRHARGVLGRAPTASATPRCARPTTSSRAGPQSRCSTPRAGDLQAVG